MRHKNKTLVNGVNGSHGSNPLNPASLPQVKRVRQFIKKNQLLDGYLSENRSQRIVLCALSGGADSVCLMRILMLLGDEFHYKLHAVHCNHHLRGSESDADQEFCEQLCARYALPISVEHLDVFGYCAEHSGISCEEGARNLRYDAFSRVAMSVDASWVATAHTASDQLETVLLNWMRGSGLRGLRGIPVTRPLCSTNVECQQMTTTQTGLKVIRPILILSRSDIEECLDACNQPFVNDSTNSEQDFFRNKIRHRIVPEMLRLSPQMLKKVAENVDIISADDEFLNKLAVQNMAEMREFREDGKAEKYGLNVDKLFWCNMAIKRRIIRHYLEEHGIKGTFSLVERVNEMLQVYQEQSVQLDNRKNCGKRMLISGKNHLESQSEEKHSPDQLFKGYDVYCRVERGILFVEECYSRKNCDFCIEVALDFHKFGNGDIVEVDVEAVKKKLLLTFWQDPHNVHKKFANNMVRCGKLIGSIFLRSRQPGDRMRLSGRDFTTHLRKAFQVFPAELRQRLLIMSDDNGPFFAENLGVAERVSIVGLDNQPQKSVRSSESLGGVCCFTVEVLELSD